MSSCIREAGGKNTDPLYFGMFFSHPKQAQAWLRCTPSSPPAREQPHACGQAGTIPTLTQTPTGDRRFGPVVRVEDTMGKAGSGVAAGSAQQTVLRLQPERGVESRSHVSPEEREETRDARDSL